MIDDDADSRKLLTTILEQCKALVTTAASAAEAISALDSIQPDIIVSDIGMPGEDGYTFINKVRSRERERGIARVPAIALTAHVRAEDQERAILSGFEAHIGKPANPSELVRVIADLLSNKPPGLQR